MRLLKLLIILGVFMMPYIVGNAKSLAVEELRQHNAEYWFANQKEAEFCHAIEWGDTDKMERMLREGLNINQQGKDGITFLIYSFFKKNKKSYEFLLKHEADQSIIMAGGVKLDSRLPFNFKYSSLSLAAGEEEDPYYLELGLKNGGNPNAHIERLIIYDAINAQSLTNVQLLVEAGADVDGLVKAIDRSTPLENAVFGGKYSIVYYLLLKGANPELNRDSIIFTMNNMLTRINQRECKEKVKKILEARGFDFSDENMERIKEKTRRELEMKREEEKTNK